MNITSTKTRMPLLRRSNRVRVQANAGTRRPSLLSRLLHPGGAGTGSRGVPTSHTSTKPNTPLFGRKKRSPVLGSSNNTPIGSSSKNDPIIGKRKSRPLFGRKKRNGPAAIVNPNNNSARRESLGQKFNRLVSGQNKKSRRSNIMPGTTTGGTKNKHLF